MQAVEQEAETIAFGFELLECLTEALPHPVDRRGERADLVLEAGMQLDVEAALLDRGCRRRDSAQPAGDQRCRDDTEERRRNRRPDGDADHLAAEDRERRRVRGRARRVGDERRRPSRTAEGSATTVALPPSNGSANLRPDSAVDERLLGVRHVVPANAAQRRLADQLAVAREDEERESVLRADPRVCCASRPVSIACSTVNPAETVWPIAMFCALAVTSRPTCLLETVAIRAAVRTAIATNAPASHQRIPSLNRLIGEVSRLSCERTLTRALRPLIGRAPTLNSPPSVFGTKSKEDDQMTHTTSRARWLASVALAAIVSSAGALLLTSGIAAGSSSSAQYEYGAPAATAQPVITGTAQVDATLTVSNGTWTSVATPTYTYAWGRCDAAGNNCAVIAGATTNQYKLVAADLGHKLVAYVSATNSAGTTKATSAPTGVVAAASTTIPAANVVLPNRLMIDKQTYSQSPIRSRTQPTQMRIHVADANGKSVQGALVYVLGVPYSRIANMPEVSTGADGWAAVTLTPAQFFPRTGYLVLSVRARVQGQDPLGGSSIRRLVQVTIAAPNGT